MNSKGDFIILTIVYKSSQCPKPVKKQPWTLADILNLGMLHLNCLDLSEEEASHLAVKAM